MKHEKWQKWLYVINEQITVLSSDRHIFWEVQAIIKKNKNIQKPSSFYSFMGTTYVAKAVMGIRRQIKNDPQSISLARLMREIIDNPTILSKTRFVALYDGSTAVDRAESDFEQFCQPKVNHVDPNMVNNDLEKLRLCSTKCEDFADRRLAHYDKREPKELATFKELDDCIDLLEELLTKYWLLFKAEALTSVLPSYLYDWKQIFKEPWLIEEKPNE